MDLGEAVLTLKVDGKEYSYQLGDAKDKTEELDKSHKKSEGTLGDLKTAYVVAAAAIAKVIKFAKELIDAYLEQEKATQRLAAAVKITGQERTINLEGLKQYAALLQRTTNIEEEATMSAMGLLMQLGGLNEKGIMQSIPLLQDFAVLMGMDLNQAAELFAKTLSSDTNALSRYGIQLKDGLDPSQKFASILEQMEIKAGGFAAAMTETTGGKMEQFNIQLGEIKETMGKFLVDVLSPTVDNLSKIFDAKDVAAGMKNVAKMSIAEKKLYLEQLKGLRDTMSEKLKTEESWGILGSKGLGAGVSSLYKTTISEYDALIKGLSENIDVMSEREKKAGDTRASVFSEATTQAQAKTKADEDEIERKKELAKLEADRSQFYTVNTEKELSQQEGRELALKKQIESEKELTKGKEEESNKIKSFDDAVRDSILANLDEIENAQKKAWLDGATKVISIMQSFSSQISSISSQITANQMSDLAAWYAAEKARIDSTITDETEKTAAMEALDKDYAQKKYKAEVDAFNVNKAIQIANVAINTASAIIKFLVDPGGFAGIALSVGSGILGGIQAGIIAAQAPPPPPAFAAGGSFDVPPGYPDDSFPMQVQSGEHVEVTPAGAEAGAQYRVIVNLSGKAICDFVTRATRDRQILVNAGAVV